MLVRNAPLLILALLGLSFASCNQETKNKSYFPLGNKASLHYKTSFKVNLKNSEQRLIITNQKPIRIDNQTLYPQTFHNNRSRYYSIANDGVFQIAKRELNEAIQHYEKPLILIQYPIKINTKWQQESQAFFVQKKVREINSGQASLSGELTINPLIMHFEITAIDEQLTIPAGRFDHCLRIDGVGQTTGSGLEIGAVEITVQQTEWYAPDVGLVKVVRSEVSNLEWAKLSHYEQVLDKIFF